MLAAFLLLTMLPAPAIGEGARQSPPEKFRVELFSPLDRGGLSLPEALKREFDDGPWTIELHGGGKRTLSSCEDYVALPGEAKDHWAGPGPDQRAYCDRGSYCHALRLAEKARPAARSFLGDDVGKLVSAGRLPPELALTISTEMEERAAGISRRGGSWLDFEPEVSFKPKGEMTWELAGEGWAGRLTVYARGDFDGDGIDDLLIRRDAWPTEGTLFHTMLVTASRAREGVPLRVGSVIHACAF